MKIQAFLYNLYGRLTVALAVWFFLTPVMAADDDNNIFNIKSLVTQAELSREQGDLISAQQKLDLALKNAENTALLPLEYAAVELANGYNLLLSNKKESAEQRLKSAYLKTAGSGYLHALANLYLAYFYLSNSDNKQAITYINTGLSALVLGEHEDLRLSLELLKLGLNNEANSAQLAALLNIAKRVDKQPANIIKAKLSLKLVQMYLDLLSSSLPITINSELQNISYSLLNELLNSTESITQHRIEADATGKLAQLNRLDSRIDQALSLTEKAISLAQNSQDHVLLAQLQAQSGDLFLVKGDRQRALTAYGLAVDDLYAVRADMPIALPDGRSVLATIIDPIHRQYVDLLLQTAGHENSEISQAALAKAIRAMEAIKEADMQDFFLGRCSVSSSNINDWREQTFPETTIVYPIVLPDRIELITQADHKLARYVVNVSEQRVQEQTQILLEALHRGKDYRAASKQLHEWLVQPIAADLKQAHAKVILFIPDGFLRAMPLSALHDGKSFVVEEFAIVTLPSLSLQNLARSRLIDDADRTLLAGLSKPSGSSIDQLPNHFVEKISGQRVEREALIEELSLPSVEQEISTVAQKESSTTLMNDQFTASALKADIETGQYHKVHIASHGYFGRNAKDSFIMAYDQNLSLLDFKASLEAESLKLEPIELLTLSACKTAEGDDRMLLGFSGLAVKSNVLSAVGSLWSINDDATMEFMRLFYDGLNRSLNKAQAMREAQINMIKNKKFKHPFFWSPFILIGNWQ
jgi:CHAT domain-containing protein